MKLDITMFDSFKTNS